MADVPPDSASVSATVELARQTAILAATLSQERASIIELAAGDMQHRERMLEDFPAPGSKRLLVHRTGNGNDVAAVPTTGVLALQGNTARLGGTIVNSGANAVILYLCGAGVATPGAPAIWLAANGGSWDFRLGNVLWCGNVTAVAQVGASTLTIAEV